MASRMSSRIHQWPEISWTKLCRSSGASSWRDNARCVPEYGSSSPRHFCLKYLFIPSVVSVNMMSPEEPGLYESRWSLVTERGAHFGDTIW